MVEQRLGIAVLARVVDRRDRRQAQPGAVGADRLGDGLHHLEQQPRAVLDRATVGVGAVVDAVAQELVQQVAVGAMHLDRIEARGHRRMGRVDVGLHDAGQFFGRQRPRRGHVDEAVLGEGLALGLTVGRRLRLGTGGLEVRMGDAADVPQLHGDLAAGFMHRVGDLLPGGDLLGRVDPRRVQITLALGNDLGALADDQAGRGALAVVLDGQRPGHQADGAVARQRRHHDAVGQGNGADLQGVEETGHGDSGMRKGMRRRPRGAPVQDGPQLSERTRPAQRLGDSPDARWGLGGGQRARQVAWLHSPVRAGAPRPSRPAGTAHVPRC